MKRGEELHRDHRATGTESTEEETWAVRLSAGMSRKRRTKDAQYQRTLKWTTNSGVPHNFFPRGVGHLRLGERRRFERGAFDFEAVVFPFLAAVRGAVRRVRDCGFDLLDFG